MFAIRLQGIYSEKKWPKRNMYIKKAAKNIKFI